MSRSINVCKGGIRTIPLRSCVGLRRACGSSKYASQRGAKSGKAGLPAPSSPSHQDLEVTLPNKGVETRSAAGSRKALEVAAVLQILPAFTVAAIVILR